MKRGSYSLFDEKTFKFQKLNRLKRGLFTFDKYYPHTEILFLGTKFPPGFIQLRTCLIQYRRFSILYSTRRSGAGFEDVTANVSQRGIPLKEILIVNNVCHDPLDHVHLWPIVNVDSLIR